MGVNRDAVQQALRVLGLDEPLTRERLVARRQELLATWNPHRYANLTNNPRKYMQMYTKGESMTREVQEAYRVLDEYLSSGQPSGS